ASFRLLGRIPLADTFVGILVAAVTVYADLAIAVIVGVIVSALVFSWKHARHIAAESFIDGKGAKVYRLHGPLFFGSAKNFGDLFDPREDPDEVIIDFADARVVDHSGLEAIDSLAERYLRAGKELHLRHLSPECRDLLDKAGSLVEVNREEDPRYHVADDRLA
ncbi:MAG: sodium-independent anion transporter, partial [Gammaproteobacteria bacterium]